MSRLTEIAISVAMLLLAINVLGLNFFVLSHQGTNSVLTTTATTSAQSCDQECQDEIINRLHPSLPNPPETKEPTVSVKSTIAPTTHEWYIPLGSGATHQQEYVGLPGIEATVDTKNYPKIKQVVFETFMVIPTANGFAFAKLYNVTKQHDVWFSEVSMETDKVTGKNATITLDPGNNVYRVMMKSTMGYEASLVNARIKIITE